MEKTQTELIGAAFCYPQSRSDMYEMKTEVHVREEDKDGNIKDWVVRITLPEKHLIESIAMRMYAEHNRYIQKIEDEDGIIHLIMKVQVELPDGILPKTKA